MAAEMKKGAETSGLGRSSMVASSVLPFSQPAQSLIPNDGQPAVTSASAATPPLTEACPQKCTNALPGQPDDAPPPPAAALDASPADAIVDNGADAAGDAAPEHAATRSEAHIAITSGKPRCWRC